MIVMIVGNGIHTLVVKVHHLNNNLQEQSSIVAIVKIRLLSYFVEFVFYIIRKQLSKKPKNFTKTKLSFSFDFC